MPCVCPDIAMPRIYACADDATVQCRTSTSTGRDIGASFARTNSGTGSSVILYIILLDIQIRDTSAMMMMMMRRAGDALGDARTVQAVKMFTKLNRTKPTVQAVLVSCPRRERVYCRKT